MDAALRDVLAGMASAASGGVAQWWGDAVCWRYMNGRRVEVDVALPLPDPDTPLGDGAAPPPLMGGCDDAAAASDTSTAATYIDGRDPGALPAPEAGDRDHEEVSAWDGVSGRLAAAFSGGSRRGFFRALASALESSGAMAASADRRGTSATSQPTTSPPPPSRQPR
jgi:hypothetical protein